MSSFCIYKSYSHFFSKNTCEFGIVLTRTVNDLTTNELVKLTMLLNVYCRQEDYYAVNVIFDKLT